MDLLVEGSRRLQDRDDAGSPRVRTMVAAGCPLHLLGYIADYDFDTNVLRRVDNERPGAIESRRGILGNNSTALADGQLGSSAFRSRA